MPNSSRPSMADPRTNLLKVRSLTIFAAIAILVVGALTIPYGGLTSPWGDMLGGSGPSHEGDVGPIIGTTVVTLIQEDFALISADGIPEPGDRFGATESVCTCQDALGHLVAVK